MVLSCNGLRAIVFCAASAFSALEGLGLRLDPQYSIVKECFPYLARRLLTEDSDRMHSMLRTFLYGKEGRYLQASTTSYRKNTVAINQKYSSRDQSGAFF